jgi:hypothetical protein
MTSSLSTYASITMVSGPGYDLGTERKSSRKHPRSYHSRCPIEQARIIICQNLTGTISSWENRPRGRMLCPLSRGAHDIIASENNNLHVNTFNLCLSD